MPPVNDEVSASTWAATLRGFNSTQTRLRVAKGEGSRVRDYWTIMDYWTMTIV